MASAIKLKNQVTKLEAAKKAASKAKNTKLSAKFQSQIEVLNSQIKALNKPTGSPAVQAAKQLARDYKAKYGVNFNGVDIQKDALVPAFKTGRRVSQGIKGNQFASKDEAKGNVYYEYRENRFDRNAKRYPKLEGGGYTADGYMKSSEIELNTREEAERVAKSLAESFGEAARNFKVEKKGDIYVVTYEFYINDVIRNAKRYPKLEDGGSLDSILLDTGAATTNNVGGTFFSNASLIPQMDITNPMFAKGGKLNNYKYVPNRMIQAVEVERNGRETEIDGANVIDGLYVKKGVKFEHGGETHRGEGGDMYAKGGMVSHGLKVGDEIRANLFDTNSVYVYNNQTSKSAMVNLNTGKRIESKM